MQWPGVGRTGFDSNESWAAFASVTAAWNAPVNWCSHFFRYGVREGYGCGFWLAAALRVQR